MFQDPMDLTTLKLHYGPENICFPQLKILPFKSSMKTVGKPFGKVNTCQIFILRDSN